MLPRARSSLLRLSLPLVLVALGACGTSGGDQPARVHQPIERFADDFERVDDLDGIAGYPGLPHGLFPEDGSRWDQLQNTHPGTNTLARVAARGGYALEASAGGRSGEEASKMALGRTRGFAFRPGQIVRLRADLRVEAPTDAPFVASTLIDLEDGDDVVIDGRPAGAGLRVRVSDGGHLQLDRGELLGSDDGVEAPHFRLSNFTSAWPMPTRAWVTIEAIVKLGCQVPRSTVGPLDTTFDAAVTAAWCELYVTPAGGARTLVLRQQGTTYLDRELGLPLLDAAGVAWTWREDDDYDVVQFGLTNNRSHVDQRLLVDDVLVETLPSPAAGPARDAPPMGLAMRR